MAIADGNLITGQNPASSLLVADKVLKALKVFTSNSSRSDFYSKAQTLKFQVGRDSNQKILMVLTNHDRLGSTGRKTGFYSITYLC